VPPDADQPGLPASLKNLRTLWRRIERNGRRWARRTQRPQDNAAGPGGSSSSNG
jgi:hypothetical protein